MKRPDNLIICDNCKRGGKPEWHGEVLDDGKTIMQGYVAQDKDLLFVLISNDPNNKINQLGVLRNRHKDQNGNDLISRHVIGTVEQYGIKPDESYHFHDINCLQKWYESNSSTPVKG